MDGRALGDEARADMTLRNVIVLRMRERLEIVGAGLNRVSPEGTVIRSRPLRKTCSDSRVTSPTRARNQTVCGMGDLSRNSRRNCLWPTSPTATERSSISRSWITSRASGESVAAEPTLKRAKSTTLYRLPRTFVSPRYHGRVSGTGVMPPTGSDSLPLARLGLVAVAAGLLATVIGRRRAAVTV